MKKLPARLKANHGDDDDNDHQDVNVKTRQEDSKSLALHDDDDCGAFSAFSGAQLLTSSGEQHNKRLSSGLLQAQARLSPTRDESLLEQQTWSKSRATPTRDAKRRAPSDRSLNWRPREAAARSTRARRLAAEAYCDSGASEEQTIGCSSQTIENYCCCFRLNDATIERVGQQQENLILPNELSNSEMSYNSWMLNGDKLALDTRAPCCCCCFSSSSLRDRVCFKLPEAGAQFGDSRRLRPSHQLSRSNHQLASTNNNNNNASDSCKRPGYRIDSCRSTSGGSQDDDDDDDQVKSVAGSRNAAVIKSTLRAQTNKYLAALLLLMILSDDKLKPWGQQQRRQMLFCADAKTISMKIGALFEETDFEQSNVFVRTIKMINEGQSEAMRQLLSSSYLGASSPKSSGSKAHSSSSAKPANANPPTNLPGALPEPVFSSEPVKLAASDQQSGLAATHRKQRPDHQRTRDQSDTNDDQDQDDDDSRPSSEYDNDEELNQAGSTTTSSLVGGSSPATNASSTGARRQAAYLSAKLISRPPATPTIRASQQELSDGGGGGGDDEAAAAAESVRSRRATTGYATNDDDDDWRQLQTGESQHFSPEVRVGAKLASTGPLNERPASCRLSTCEDDAIWIINSSGAGQKKLPTSSAPELIARLDLGSNATSLLTGPDLPGASFDQLSEFAITTTTTRGESDDEQPHARQQDEPRVVHSDIEQRQSSIISVEQTKTRAKREEWQTMGSKKGPEVGQEAQLDASRGKNQGPSDMNQNKNRNKRHPAAGEPGFSIWNPLASFMQQDKDGSSSSSLALVGEPSTWAAHPNEPVTRVKFEPMVEFLAKRHSSFEADKRVCQLIESGVRTVVGPLEGLSIQHVQSICDNMELPYFQLRPLLGSVSRAPLNPLARTWPQSAKQGANQAAESKYRRRNDEQVARHSLARGYGDSVPLDSKADVATSTGNVSVGAARTEQLLSLDNNNGPINASDEERNHAHAPPSRKGGSDEPDLSVVVASTNNDKEDNYQYKSLVDEPPADDLLTLNLHPPAHLLTSAYIDLIYAWNWTSFAIVYEDESSMIKLQDLFRESSGTWTSRWKIRLFRYRQPANQKQDEPELHQDQHLTLEAASILHHHDPTTSEPAIEQQETFRDLFWRIKKSGEQNILLDLAGQNLNEALKQAQQVGCMTDRFNYLITSLDLHIADLENFKYGRTRITALSLISLEPHLPDLSRNHLADEHYLEQLGIQVLPRSPAYQSYYSTSGLSSSNSRHRANVNYATLGGSSTPIQANFRSSKFPKFKLSPSIVLDKAGSFMDPPTDAFSSARNGVNWRESSGVARSNHVDMGGQGFGQAGTGEGTPTHHTSGYQIARSQAEDELFHLLIEQQVDMHNLSRMRLATSSAILHDSLVLLALGLRELDPSGNYISNSTNKAQMMQQEQSDDLQLSCSNPNSGPWRYGSSLINYMRRLSFTGLTGQVRFDRRGLRSSFKLNILGVANEIGLVKVGEWHSDLHNQSWFAADQQQRYSADQDNDDNELLDVDAELARVKRRLMQQQLDDSSLDNDKSSTSSPEQRQNPFQIPYKVSLSRSGALKVNRIIFERLYKEQTDQVDTLIVTTKLSQPYFMLKETPNKLEGNDQYEGFAVDLIHELSRLLNFRYRWREVADKKYGSREMLPNGTLVWNGMIGEIVRGDADLAIVDLTITSQREEAVDFTLPFMNTGISILFKKPTTKVTTLYSFLSPFTRDVWASVLAAYCGISAILFLVGHVSPYEWSDPHPCPHLRSDDSLLDMAMLHNQFSLPNSFWFTIGSLMQQGSDLTPRSMSTRTIAGIWYFFTLIMISSYTANLAAFLTVEKVIYPIENVRDLANQQEIRYGCVESGSTCTFFKDSQIDTYKRINETMHKFKSYLKSNEEGQKRVEEGKFAFFMESASIEYIVERNCNLTQIGGLLDSKGYGLATSKKSRLKRPYRTLLSEGILHLQETGMLHVLKNRWWKERRGGGTCADDGKGGGVTELSLANVGGVFVVLVGGLCFAFTVAMGEFLWRSKRNGMSRNNLCDHMMNDLKFALNCTKSAKTLTQQERLAKRQRSLTRLSSSQRSQSQSESQSQLNNNLCNSNQNQPQLIVTGQPQGKSRSHHSTPSEVWSWKQQPGELGHAHRTPVVGFSTSEEAVDTSDIHSQLRRNQQNYQQPVQYQNPTMTMQQNQLHLEQQSSLRHMQAAKQMGLHQQQQQQSRYQLPMAANHIQQRRPIVIATRGPVATAASLLGDSTSLRRQLFAQQTVATIQDDELFQARSLQIE